MLDKAEKSASCKQPNNSHSVSNHPSLPQQQIMELTHWIGSKRARTADHSFRLISKRCSAWIWNFNKLDQWRWEGVNQSGKAQVFHSLGDRDGFIAFLERHDYTGPHMPLNFELANEWEEDDDSTQWLMSESDIARDEEHSNYAYWSGDPDWDA